MRQLNLKEIKKIQCDIMQNAHDFMMEHGLKYSLACGTLIGAVRHKGYIPWDDDIDIYMPREDYRKLIEIFPEEYRERYKLVSYERCSRWCRPYANIYDNYTVWEEKKTNAEMTIGVNIDIFPVDNVPDDEREWKKFNKKRRKLFYIWAAKHTSFRWNNRSFFRFTIILILKLLLLPVPIKKIVKFFDSYIQQYNSVETNRLFESASGILQKKPFMKKDFENVILLPFENHSFFAMKGYDDYLTNGFGNYMELPPVEKRKSHHYYKAYLKD